MLARLLRLLPFSLWLLPALVHASPLTCGVYTTPNNGDILTITSATEGHVRRGGPLVLRKQENRVLVHDLENGREEHWTLEADGQHLRTEADEVFALHQSVACNPTPPPATDGCRADLPACFLAVHRIDDTTLTSWCMQERLPFVCAEIIHRFRREAHRKAQGLSEQPDTIAECVEGSREYSEAACREKGAQALAQAVAQAFGSMYSDDIPLDGAQLDQSLAFCQQTGSGHVCMLAAESLWVAGRYVAARTALTIACERNGDASACGKWAMLADLDSADLQVVKADTLPCGSYVAAEGLMSKLNFMDRGLVEGGFGSIMRARLQDDRIRIRHDKGGDFVFAALRGERLIGLDGWNRFAVYHRQPGGSDRCAPPIQYIERPLLQDCPGFGEGAARACCDAGKLQGCNEMGHLRALANDWSGARPYYQRVCAAGVRIGCENLAHNYGYSGDEANIESLQQLCATDERHVACDVLETSNWETRAAIHELQQSLEPLENSEEQKIPPAPDA